MSSYSTKYRNEHPEYYKQEHIKDNESVKKLYHINIDFLFLINILESINMMDKSEYNPSMHVQSEK